MNLLPNEDIGSIDTEKLIHQIVNFYYLEPEVAKSLHFLYHTHTSTGKISMVERFNEGKLLDEQVNIDDKGDTHPLYFDQLKLFKKVKAGLLYHADTSCDSDFMLNQVDAIGKAIYHAYHDTVSDKIPIYLVMDNIDRHGTVEAKEIFVERLEIVYNVRVNWQVPNSPNTNMLDLGVLMTFQSKVEELHCWLVMDNAVLGKQLLKHLKHLTTKKLPYL